MQKKKKKNTVVLFNIENRWRKQLVWTEGNNTRERVEILIEILTNFFIFENNFCMTKMNYSRSDYIYIYFKILRELCVYINIIIGQMCVCVYTFVRKFTLSWVALNDTKTRLSLMTRHGIVTGIILSSRARAHACCNFFFFSCQSSPRTPPYPFVDDCLFTRFGTTYF